MKRDLTEHIQVWLTESGLVRGLANAVQKIMNALFLNSPLKPLKTFLNGTWLEHPLHPVLTDVPVGAWTAALVLDLIALIFGAQDLGFASAIVGGLGTLAAVATIITGLMDWMDVDPPELAVGITHGLINTAATVLFAISFLMRRASGWTITFANFLPALVGYLLLIGGAYIGGLLVFRMGVMINRDAWQHGPDNFVPVMRMDQLPENQPVRVNAEGRPVMLFRCGEEVCALSAVCSHYGGPLNEGTIVDGAIQCPWHSSRFSLSDGSVQAGPATSPVPAYDVRLRGDQIEVRERHNGDAKTV